MIDAMNYLGSNGWDFVQSYTVTNSNENVLHWILKRDISTFSKEEQDAFLKSSAKTKK